MQPFGTKNHATSPDKNKIMEPLRTQKNNATSRDKKNHLTSWDKKNETTLLGQKKSRNLSGQKTLRESQNAAKRTSHRLSRCQSVLTKRPF